VSCDDDTTVKPVADWPPNLTALAPVRFEPPTVTEVPPATGPDAGATLVTVGDGDGDGGGGGGGGGGVVVPYVYWLALLVGLVPAPVETATWTTLPSDAAGTVAVIDVGSLIVYDVEVLAKLTPVAPSKPVPVIVTLPPPDGSPVAGDRLDTDGTTGLMLCTQPLTFFT
jgi:hypothetical protein